MTTRPFRALLRGSKRRWPKELATLLADARLRAAFRRAAAAAAAIPKGAAPSGWLPRDGGPARTVVLPDVAGAAIRALQHVGLTLLDLEQPLDDALRFNLAAALFNSVREEVRRVGFSIDGGLQKEVAVAAAAAAAAVVHPLGLAAAAAQTEWPTPASAPSASASASAARPAAPALAPRTHATAAAAAAAGISKIMVLCIDGFQRFLGANPERQDAKITKARVVVQAAVDAQAAAARSRNARAGPEAALARDHVRGVATTMPFTVRELLAAELERLAADPSAALDCPLAPYDWAVYVQVFNADADTGARDEEFLRPFLVSGTGVDSFLHFLLISIFMYSE